MTVEAVLAPLPLLLKGLGGIFLVIGVIMLVIWLLNKAFPEKQEES